MAHVDNLEKINELNSERKRLNSCLQEMADDKNNIDVGIRRTHSSYGSGFHTVVSLDVNVVRHLVRARLQLVEAELRGFGVQL
jgi:hypothetical protein